MSNDLDVNNPKARGLGRGLNALFDDEESNFSGEGVSDVNVPGAGAARRDTIAVEFLKPGALQPRHVFDDDALDELAASIREHGLLQPLLVRADKKTLGQYEIIAGERRWRASQRAQLHELPVIILDLDDTQVLEVGLIENLQREDLNPIDEALGYQKLMQEYGHTQEKLAKAMGKSRSHIANMVRLLNLPADVQELVADNGLSMGHARALVSAKNPSELAQQVVEKGLSVREVERLAAQASGREVKGDAKANGKNAKKPSAANPKDADTLALEEELTQILGMSVNIDSPNGHQGHLSVEFKSLDQLDELLQRISQTPNNCLDG